MNQAAQLKERAIADSPPETPSEDPSGEVPSGGWGGFHDYSHLGPIAQFVADPTVTEIMVMGSHDVYAVSYTHLTLPTNREV